jgi:hypothetical protein
VAFALRFFAAGDGDGVREMSFSFSLSSARLPLDSISGAEGHEFDFHGIQDTAYRTWFRDVGEGGMLELCP